MYTRWWIESHFKKITKDKYLHITYQAQFRKWLLFSDEVLFSPSNILRFLKFDQNSYCLFLKEILPFQSFLYAPQPYTKQNLYCIQISIGLQIICHHNKQWHSSLANLSIFWQEQSSAIADPFSDMVVIWSIPRLNLQVETPKLFGISVK